MTEAERYERERAIDRFESAVRSVSVTEERMRIQQTFGFLTDAAPHRRLVDDVDRARAYLMHLLTPPESAP